MALLMQGFATFVHTLYNAGENLFLPFPNASLRREDRVFLIHLISHFFLFHHKANWLLPHRNLPSLHWLKNYPIQYAPVPNVGKKIIFSFVFLYLTEMIQPQYK